MFETSAIFGRGFLLGNRESNMELTEKQKAISEDPKYWEWFQDWWEADYSWNGLSDKETLKGVPLQTYYPSTKDERYLISAFGKEWRIINVPFHDLDGNTIHEKISRHTLDSNLRQYLKEYGIEEIHGCVFPKHSITLNRKFSCVFSRCSALMKHGPGTASNKLKLSYARNCFIEETTVNSMKLTDCIVATASISGPVNWDEDVTIEKCQLPNEISFSCGSLRLLGNFSNQRIIVNAKLFMAENLACEFLEVNAYQKSGPFAIEPMAYVFNYKIHLLSTVKTHVHIKSVKTTKTEEHITPSIVSIDSSSSHWVNLVELKDVIVDLAGDAIGGISIVNCQVSSKLNILPEKVRYLEILGSVLNHGISITNVTIDKFSRISGCKVQGTSQFNNSTFKNGFEISSLEQEDGVDIQSTINSADFTYSTFFFDGPISKPDRDICALNLSNTRFQNGFNFDHVKLFGYVDVTDSFLPSNASFQDLRLPQFLPLTDETYDGVLSKDQYTSYQTSFRILRQFMEKNKNFTEVHKFGRLEAIAKERRGITQDVTAWEYRLTKWYGKFADYGQSIERPLKWLLGLFGASFVCQYLVFWLSHRPCIAISDSCNFNTEGLSVVLERASTFALPPFSALAKRSAPSIETDQSAKMFESALSETLMLVHGVLASILMFLFLLAVKRRLQFK